MRAGRTAHGSAMLANRLGVVDTSPTHETYLAAVLVSDDPPAIIFLFGDVAFPMERRLRQDGLDEVDAIQHSVGKNTPIPALAMPRGGQEPIRLCMAQSLGCR